MYPHWHHWHRGPSRLWWFIIGAGVATWWHKSRDVQEFRLRHCSRHHIPAEAYSHPVQPQNPPPQDASTRVGNAPSASGTSAPGEPTLPPISRREQETRWGWCWNSPWSQSPAPPFDPWDEGRMHTEELSNKANEKFMEISEATIDGALKTVESLKAKLAEHRAQKEQRARELQAMREEQMRQYEEWKNSQPPRHIV